MIRYVIPQTPQPYTQTDGILRFNADGSQSSIPASLDNSDWVAYLSWLEEGNEPEAAQSL